MTLSIIIVNYRSWSFLEDCLAGLLSDPQAGDWQIIVVDNHSCDGELENFSRRFDRVSFIANSRNGGFAFGCNTGAGIASGKRLLFLNPDVMVRPGEVPALLAAADRHPDVAILTATQVNAKDQVQKAWDVFPNLLTYFKSVKSVMRKLVPAYYPDPRAGQKDLVYCDWVSGSILLIKREDFDDLGGWCEDYWMYAEDCDLCYLAHARGLRVACTPDVRFVHLHGGASRQNREITVLTKCEAIISKHVFNHRHRTGIQRALNHLFISLSAVPELMLWSVLNLLTLHRINALTIRSSMLLRILGHYLHVFHRGDWRSRQINRGCSE